jgi:hypothetical protein
MLLVVIVLAMNILLKTLIVRIKLSFSLLEPYVEQFQVLQHAVMLDTH